MVRSAASGDAASLGAGRGSGSGSGSGAAERSLSEALCLARAVAALAMTHSEGDGEGGDGVGGFALSSPTSILCSNQGGERRVRCGAMRSHRRGGGSRLMSGRALAAANAEDGGGAIAKAVGRFRSACLCACATSDVSATSRRTRSRCHCQSASSTPRLQFLSLRRAAGPLRPHRISVACTFSSRGESGAAEHARAKQRRSGSSGRYVSGVQGTTEALVGASGRSRRNMRQVSVAWRLSTAGRRPAGGFVSLQKRKHRGGRVHGPRLGALVGGWGNGAAHPG